MRILYGFVFCLITLCANSQGRPLLIVRFDTKIVSKPSVTFKNIEPKTKEDSILLEFSKEFTGKIGQESFTTTVLDSVIVYNDSAVIITIPQQVNSHSSFGKINFNPSKAVYKNKKFYSVERDGELLYWDESGYQNYIPTNKSETIAGYKTQVYISADSTCKIWVCKSLSTLINPSVQIIVPLGAILKYEIRQQGQLITSIVNKIKFLK